MSFTVIWTNPAVTAYRTLRGHDHTGAATVRAGILALAGDPRPTGSRQFGGTDFHRLRIGDYRVLYRVDDAAATIVVENVGRIGPPSASD